MKKCKPVTRFERNTSNTIDDVTGAIVKLSETSLRWDKVRCTDLNWEIRQPQDFPPTPKAIKSYPESRADVTMPVPTPLSVYY